MERTFELVKKYPGSPELGMEVVRMVYRDGHVNYSNKEHGSFPAEYIENNPEFWKETTKKEKDWEILEFRPTGGGNSFRLQIDGTYSPNDYKGVSLESMLRKGSCVESGHWQIHSVRRLSDSEVFTVGDEVWENGWTIKSFNISEVGYNYLMVLYEKGLYQKCQHISVVTKRPQPILTTADGVKKYAGDFIWIVYEDFKILKGELTKTSSVSKSKHVFSTREVAEKYAIENMPLFSMRDICYKPHIHVCEKDLNTLKSEATTRYNRLYPNK